MSFFLCHCSIPKMSLAARSCGPLASPRVLACLTWNASRDPSIWSNVLLVVFAVAVGIAALAWRYGPNVIGISPPGPPTNLREVKYSKGLYENEKSIHDLYVRAKPSVVNVTSLTSSRNVYSRNLECIPKGMGSGFIWDKEGRIVTNYHVIQGAQYATVTLDDCSTAGWSTTATRTRWRTVEAAGISCRAVPLMMTDLEPAAGDGPVRAGARGRAARPHAA